MEFGLVGRVQHMHGLCVFDATPSPTVTARLRPTLEGYADDVDAGAGPAFLRMGYDSRMPGRRSITGVLCGFLGTYTSRYSDFDGYWIFGFLVAQVVDVKFDLWATEPFRSRRRWRSPRPWRGPSSRSRWAKLRSPLTGWPKRALRS
jgi:hypothetical protein